MNRYTLAVKATVWSIVTVSGASDIQSALEHSYDCGDAKRVIVLEATDCTPIGTAFEPATKTIWEAI